MSFPLNNFSTWMIDATRSMASALCTLDSHSGCLLATNWMNEWTCVFPLSFSLSLRFAVTLNPDRDFPTMTELPLVAAPHARACTQTNGKVGPPALPLASTFHRDAGGREAVRRSTCF